MRRASIACLVLLLTAPAYIAGIVSGRASVSAAALDVAPAAPPPVIVCDVTDLDPSAWTRTTDTYPAWQVDCRGYSQPGRLIIVD